MKKRKLDLVPVAILTAFLLLAGSLYFGETDEEGPVYRGGFGSFSSTDEVERYVRNSAGTLLPLGPGCFGGTGVARPAISPPVAWNAKLESKTFDAGVEHSETNVQVEGVGEADIVKNDGEHIYAVSGKEVSIVKAYPPENLQVVSKVTAKGGITGIYVWENRLVILGRIEPKDSRHERSFVDVYDVTERGDPERIGSFSSDGRYFDSRMIDGHVYLVSVLPAREENVFIPESSTDGEFEKFSPSNIHRFGPPVLRYRFTNVVSIDVKRLEMRSRESYLTASTQNIYVSRRNIYINGMEHFKTDLWKEIVDEAILPSLPSNVSSELESTWTDADIDPLERHERFMETLKSYLNGVEDGRREEFFGEVRKKARKIEEKFHEKTFETTIHRISIDDGEIEHSAKGKVPGRVLNRFSMSEHKGYFRIATTTGRLSRSSEEATAANHVFILDQDLNTVGALENLAPNEKIYSARFMGGKCYLVTFRKVDPLFVLDLSSPSDPKVLGKLKIPGYSDYLHPYGENYLIGIGKSTTAAESGDFSWYQGVKIALFDVGDVSEPKQISKLVIGDRGTESLALHDHHAFLFSKDKNLLSVPVTLAEINENKYPNGVPPNQRGEYVWQGAYLLSISPDRGIEIRGRTSHIKDKETFEKSGHYFSSHLSVKRSLYIGNVFYTYSEGKVKANHLEDLRFIDQVSLK